MEARNPLDSRFMKKIPPTRHIAVIGNYLPRHCGLASFTTDICEAIASEFPETTCIAGVVNDRAEGYDYPSRVRFEIAQEDPDSYRRAAEFLRINNVEVVSLQHEFGIFGGPAGGHVLEFLRFLKKPVVTTLHTVLRNPSPVQREVMRQLDELSDRFVVMAARGGQLLKSVYGVAAEKIDLIPHGVIDMPFVDANFYKDIFEAEGKTVLLTFGLLSPNKGIEHVIQAMPAILEKHPETVYLVVGATHPHLVASEGEAYRSKLRKLAWELGVGGQVVFHDKFVSTEELKEFIGGADIYITPYLNEEQVTSGTLAYAFGAGKAIISTPYWHAQELLAEERGILVPFAEAAAIAEAVNHFLAHPTLMTAMRKRAWKEGRAMIWPEVARRYLESFEQARSGLSVPSCVEVEERARVHGDYVLPTPKLDHLFRMSDHTGIFQHAIYNVPNYHEAYCTDDNARAFIFTVHHQALHGAEAALDRLASSYLAFLWHAFDSNTRRFRNFMSHERRWLETKGSEDSHARALWAVGTALGRSDNEGHRNLSALLFQRGLEPVKYFSSPRAWAFTLVAIHEYLRAFSGDRVVAQMRETLVARLLALFHANATPDWRWFERIATYDNAKLCHALILSGQEEAMEIGIDSLRWLLAAQTGESGQFSPIGCHGFWPHGEKKARFDQQPVETQAMVSACLAAFKETDDPAWLDEAKRCFEWFLGRNDLGLALYDPSTGGCRDALLQDHLNQNQGAESTLAFHLSLVELTRATRTALGNELSFL